MNENDLAWKRFQVAIANAMAVQRKEFSDFERNQRIKQLWVAMSLTSTQKRKSKFSTTSAKLI